MTPKCGKPINNLMDMHEHFQFCLKVTPDLWPHVYFIETQGLMPTLEWLADCYDQDLIPMEANA